jgi:hypothetical protein
MKRAVLPVITFGLFAMVVVDRISHSLERAGDPPPVQGPSDTRSATVDLTNAPDRSAAVEARQPAGPATGTPTLDRLARLAARQQLSRAAGSTYLDSLIISTDSVVRRWPDRHGLPLRVAVIEGGPATYDPRMAGFFMKALERWEAAGTGVRFTTVADTGSADVQVRWIDHFDFDRAGQTDLTWDQAGRVRKAVVLLAIRTNTGVALPDAALLTVAVHEAGHALGLPHSPDTNDVMFPATQTGELSERDRRTAQILYQLPTGPVRDSTGTP